MRRFITASMLVVSLAAGAVGATAASAATHTLRGRFVRSIASHHGSQWNLFSHGKRVGSATFRCNQQRVKCSGSFELGRGSLRAEIPINPSIHSDRGSITGGTGSYSHAHGSFVLRLLTATSVLFTIHLT